MDKGSKQDANIKSNHWNTNIKSSNNEKEKNIKFKIKKNIK